MKFKIVPVTAFQQNCSIVWCEQSKKGAVIDPGGDVDRLIEAITAEGITLEYVLLTHGHLDHVGAAKTLATHYAVPIVGPHEEDRFLFDGLTMQSQLFNLPDCGIFYPDRWLTEGETIQFGDVQFNVIHTPGHTPGHVVFYQKETKLMFVGDVIFYRSIGRSDFPRGDHAELMRSIQKLLTYGDEITFIPGHGPRSTFGSERQHNPFLVG